jgi:hypothetical protein
MAEHETPISIGFAKTPITDCGERRDIPLHDDLCAGLIWIGSGNEATLLVTLDHVEMRSAPVAATKAIISKMASIPSERIIITCSHTHTGVDLKPEKLGDVVGQAAVSARDTATPCSIAYARVHTEGRFSVNRRINLDGLGALSILFYRNNIADPINNAMDVCGQVRDFIRHGANLYRPDYQRNGADLFQGCGSLSKKSVNLLRSLPERIDLDGVVDPYIDALEFRRQEDGLTVGTLVRFACHPVIMSDGRHPCYSADFPGILTRELSRAGGAPAFFVNGPSGDVKPLITEQGQYEMERVGFEMAELLKSALAIAECEPVTHFHFDRCEKTFKLAPDMYNVTKEDLNVAEAEFLNVAKSEYDPVTLRKAMEHLIRVWAAGPECYAHTDKNVTLPFSVLGFNEIALVMLPGEIFTTHSGAIKRRFPGKRIITVELADTDAPGYVPTREDFELGGYEVAASCLPRGSGEKMVDLAETLLKKFYATVGETIRK